MTAARATARSATRTLTVPHWLLLGMVLLVALAARTWEASRSPLWFDEIFSLMVARQDVGGVLRALAADMHPPLHFLLEHLWIRLGGEGGMWLKWLSILTGLATVWALASFAGELFGEGAGLFAALLLAVHRTHVYFSQEARSYALLWLLYVLAAWMAWRWVTRGRRADGALYALAATAALYTHYQAGLVLAFVGLWGLVALARVPRRAAAWIAIHALVALLFLPQLPTMLAQARRLGAEHWISPVSTAMLIDVFRQLAFGQLRTMPVLLALALVPLVVPGRRGAAALALAISIAPVLAAYGMGLTGASVFTDRYMMFALPGWCALLAAGLAAVRWAWLRAGAALVIVLIALRSLLIHPPNTEAVALERAERWLSGRVRPGDVVVCADTHTLFFLETHAPGLGRPVLLLASPHLPYYEGAQFVPEAQRVRLAAFDSLTAGRRWFGVRTRHGGIDSRPAFERMLAGAHGVEGFEPTTIVAGQ